MKSGNKRTGSKKSAVAALCVVLVLTILIGVIGFTGLAIPPRGLYKVRSWLPTADSEKWPEKPVFATREVLSHQIIHADYYDKNVKKLPKTAENQSVIDFDEIEKLPMPKIMILFLKHLE